HCYDGLEMERFRNERQGWRDQKRKQRADLVGEPVRPLPEEPQQLARAIAGEEHEPAGHLADGMQCELELRHHAEVAAAATQTPEEVAVLSRARTHHRPVACDDRG